MQPPTLEESYAGCCKLLEKAEKQITMFKEQDKKHKEYIHALEQLLEFSTKEFTRIKLGGIAL